MHDDWRKRLGGLHPATKVLRDVLDGQEEFRAAVGSHLAVNSTDLAAMEVLIAEGHASPSRLADKLGLTTAGMTSVIDRLEALNHVSRQPNPHDRRGVRVVPNPRSIEAAVDMISPMIIAVDDVLTRFGPDEQRAIMAYLDGVAEVYRRYTEPSPGVTSGTESAISHKTASQASPRNAPQTAPRAAPRTNPRRGRS